MDFADLPNVPIVVLRIASLSLASLAVIGPTSI
jgi:hypothetical protein